MQQPPTLPDPISECVRNEMPPALAESVLSANAGRCRQEWLMAAGGMLLLALTLWAVFPKAPSPGDYMTCAYAVPQMETLPESLRYLFVARRCLTVPDASVELGRALTGLRARLRAAPHDDQARLLRFYLIYDPLLNPNHLQRISSSETLRERVESAFVELDSLPVDSVTKAALEARLRMARWVLASDDRALLDAAWQATGVSRLRLTVDALELRLFLLRRLCEHRGLTEQLSGKIWLDGAYRRADAIDELRATLIAERNRIREAQP